MWHSSQYQSELIVIVTSSNQRRDSMSGKYNRGKRSHGRIPVKKPHCRSKHEQLRKAAMYQANRLNRMELQR